MSAEVLCQPPWHDGNGGVHQVGNTKKRGSCCRQGRCCRSNQRVRHIDDESACSGRRTTKLEDPYDFVWLVCSPTKKPTVMVTQRPTNFYPSPECNVGEEELQRSGSGYMGSAYCDAIGSSRCGKAAWKFDPPCVIFLFFYYSSCFDIKN